MKINEDNKIDILRDLLKERYEASHKMRDRSLKFAIWVLGFGIALIWILLSGLSLGLVQKIILTIFVVIVGFLTGIFLKSIDKGFVNNRKVMIRIEEALGCYENGVYVENGPLFPNEYKDLSKKNTAHFTSIYYWLVVMGLVLISVIWLGPCR